MADDTDFITLTDDEDLPPPRSRSAGPAWKVAVIDDDAAVHDGTRFALQDYMLNGRGLQLISARSKEEGRRLLNEHPDTAVILLDVVMESDTAGLELVTFVRDELKNETVRIILRTGQPGQAPEQRIVVEYDINDYKSKTELTAEKLFTALTSAIRSYEQLRRLVDTRRGLEVIIDAAAALFDVRSLAGLAEGVIAQLASLIDVPPSGLVFVRAEGDDDITVVASSGTHDGDLTGLPRPDQAIVDAVREVLDRGVHRFEEDHCILFVSGGAGRNFAVLLDTPKPLSDIDRALAEVLASRLSAAFENVSLYEQLRRANNELEDRVARRTQELLAANERLEARWSRLRSANAFKNEILGTVAHDLKNPLGVILGRTEMLTDMISGSADLAAIPKATAQLDHIREAAQRMTAMVDSLIADAMADALDISVRRETLDLAELTREVIAANEIAASRKEQKLSLSAPARLELRGDLDRLREALDNLISNAIKYTPQAGAISAVVALRGSEAVVRIIDTGPGFSPEDMNRIFGRFQRLSAKPTGGETSTGLGLSIAKRIVELHSGRLSAENAPGGGAILTLALPVEPPIQDA